MISEQDAALQRAQAYVRNRGWRCEPLAWEEVEVLLKNVVLPTELRSRINAAYDDGFDDGAAFDEEQAS
jgi:hypothetical protein